eukprot:1160755-Pelagomonas_calceolata.AAC.14
MLVTVPSQRFTPPPNLSEGNNQLDGAFDYLKKVGGTAMDAKALEEAAGVGVVSAEARCAKPYSSKVQVEKKRKEGQIKRKDSVR